MKKLIPLFLLIILSSCTTPERTITIATPPEDINSLAVREIQWALSCDENYSDACQYVFWYCGASDFPNKKYETYTQCVVQEYRDFTSN